jgi:hypothetical protein
MRKFTFTCIPLLLLASQSVLAYDWQTPLMWDWALSTASPTLDEHESDIAALQTQMADQAALIASLQADLSVSNAYIQDLQSYVSVDDTTNPSRPVVMISGANLQVTNGLGSTLSTNGVGNILVGYDESMLGLCYIVPANMEDLYDATACANSGGLWLGTVATKTGSHNLIVGDRHAYTAYSSIVSGTANFSTAKGASIIGGAYNSGVGAYSATIGGILNHAEGRRSTVTGGATNTAESTSLNGSISGGSGGTVSGDADWKAGTLFEDN